MRNSGIGAILWDYDGTLADSSRKNIEVTLDVLGNFIPDIKENLPEELSSGSRYYEIQTQYPDWTEIYRKVFGLSDEQVVEAGKLWAGAQLNNHTEAELFPGMAEVLENLEHVKMGICSQNGKDIILRSLEHRGVLKYINAVVGYDDVGYTYQKPDPTAFLMCLKKMEVFERCRRFVYVGDHSVDMAFGRNAEAALRKDFPEAEVVCVALHHKGFASRDSEEFPPDYSVRSAGELLSLLKELDI